MLDSKDCIEDDVNFSSKDHALAPAKIDKAGRLQNASKGKLNKSFFKVTDVALPSLTLLGETSMDGVDFFAQTYDCIEILTETSVLVCPTNTHLVVPRLDCFQFHV